MNNEHSNPSCVILNIFTVSQLATLHFLLVKTRFVLVFGNLGGGLESKNKNANLHALVN